MLAWPTPRTPPKRCSSLARLRGPTPGMSSSLLPPVRTLARREYVERAGSPQAYVAFFKETFGPAVAVYAGLEPERAAELDATFLDFAVRANDGPPEGPAAYRYEYLLAVALLSK